MAANTWKLVVTALNGQAGSREVAVEAENWLSALRLARKQLGEDGGVPQGASCVMSASGEVTILDAAQRRKYVLTRLVGDLRATAPNVSAPVAPHSPGSAPAVTPPPRGLAEPAPPVAPVSPHLATAERAAAPAAGAPPLAPPTGTPAAPPAVVAPARPAQPHPAPVKRSVTVAYSPEEAAALREQVIAVQAATVPAQGTAGQAHQPQHGAAPVPPGAALPTPLQERAAPTAAPARKATVAYLENPFAGDALVPVGSRDEEPNASSPLTYRERTYFTPRTLEPARLESLLRSELQRLQQGLEGAPRGRFVNLAVFDHYFQGKPQRPPLATLQWKDWRGDAVFALAGVQRLPTWRPPAEGPVHSSFAPPPAAAPAPDPWLPLPAPVGPAAAAQPVPATLPQPVVAVRPPAPVAAPLPAPVAAPPPAAVAAPLPAAVAAPLPPAAAPLVAPPAAVDPAHDPFAPRDPWSAPETREPTGDQDRRLAVAFETTQDLYFLPTPVEGLEFAIKLLGELVPCEALGGAIYDINADVLRFVALSGPGSAERRAEAVPSSAGLLAAAVRSGRESLVINDLDGDARFDAAADGRIGLAARSLAYLPLQKKDHLLGMLQLLNRQDERGFSEADIAVASYVAGQLADFLQTRRRR